MCEISSSLRFIFSASTKEISNKVAYRGTKSVISSSGKVSLRTTSTQELEKRILPVNLQELALHAKGSIYRKLAEGAIVITNRVIMDTEKISSLVLRLALTRILPSVFKLSV